MLDHVAKPPVRSGDLGAWADGVAALAELPNATCNLSGLFTEAEPGAALELVRSTVGDADRDAVLARTAIRTYGLDASFRPR